MKHSALIPHVHRRLRFWLGIAAIGMMVSPLTVAEPMQPGLWQITLKSRVAATPDWNPDAFQLTQCLTEQDAENPDRLLTGLGTTGATGCEFLDRQATGQQLRFKVRCAGTLGIEGQGTVNFTATTVRGELTVRFAASEGATEAVEMQNQLQAVYVGPCSP